MRVCGDRTGSRSIARTKGGEHMGDVTQWHRVRTAKGTTLMACSELHATELAWRITQRALKDVVAPARLNPSGSTSLLPYCRHCAFCGVCLQVPEGGECVFHANKAICTSFRFEQTWIVGEVSRIIRRRMKTDITDLLHDIIVSWLERHPTWVSKDPDELAALVVDPF
jgi:hypothetical protein